MIIPSINGLKKIIIVMLLFTNSITICIPPQQRYETHANTTSMELTSLKEQVVTFGKKTYTQAHARLVDFTRKYPNAAFIGGIIGIVVGAGLFIKATLSKLVQTLVGAALCTGGIIILKESLKKPLCHVHNETP